MSLTTKEELIIDNKFNKKEFQKIYDLQFNPLCAFALKYIQNIEAVEDIVQEAFISLWEKRKDFNEIFSIKSFLYTSIRNKCLNQIKHKKVVQKHEELLIYQLESEQLFTQHVIEEETFNRLYQEIHHLPDASKEIMLLALNGLKNPEIAEELNISVNTVKTQKKIAYSKLKLKLIPSEFAVLPSL